MLRTRILGSAKRVLSAAGAAGNSSRAWNGDLPFARIMGLLEPQGSRNTSILDCFVSRSLSSTASLAEVQRPKKRRCTSDGFVKAAKSSNDICSFLDSALKDNIGLEKNDGRSLIHFLRTLHRYQKAIKVSEWMQKHFEVSSGDHGLRIDLIGKAYGLAEAEEYFKKLSKSEKGSETYAAMLHCYVKVKNIEKAEHCMEKIKELGYTNNELPFIDMMTLYMSTKQPEKVITVAESLKKFNQKLGPVTHNILLSAYAAMQDFESIENSASEIKRMDQVKQYSAAYCNLANIYIKSNLSEKARVLIEELENEIPNRNKSRALWDHLIILYARLNDKEGVWRTWESLKETCKRPNFRNYTCMHASLLKIQEVEAAEKLFNEWYSENGSNNYQHACHFLKQYLNGGLSDKAKVLQKKLVEGNMSGKKWELIAEIYIRHKLFDQAIPLMKKAFAEEQPTNISFKPRRQNVIALLKHFELEGNTDGAEEIMRLLREKKCEFLDAYNVLLSIYVKAGNATSIPTILEQMKKANITPNQETHQILKDAGQSVV